MTVLSENEIYAAYREKVLSYLCYRAASREDAEELCQEVFAEVYRCLPRYDAERASLSTWIYQITRFTLIDYLRKRRTASPLPEDFPAAGDPAEDFIRRETLERLASALNTLEREERDIIILRYFKGQSLTEVSRLTGISYGMVKVKHKKALGALKNKLGQDGR